MSSDRFYFPSAFALFLAIAGGVFVGGLGAGLAYTEITVYRAEKAAERVLSAAAAQQQAREEREAQKQQALSRMLAGQQQAADRARAQDRAKEAAWREYFKPSAICRDDAARGDCADEHIRARRKFEEIWKNKNN